MPPRRVLVAGFYGHGNLGDEAILEAMLAGLREARPDISATVVSGDPEATAARHAVHTVNERDWPALIDAATACDAIVLGGGLFHDDRGTDENTIFTRAHAGLAYCAAFPALAAMIGRPMMLCAVGVGPLRSPDGARLTRLVAERADGITVRDADSAEILRGLGIASDRIGVTADPAFLIPSAPADRARVLLDRAGVPAGTRLIAVAVRHRDMTAAPDRWQPHLAAALDRLADGGATILFVPFQAGRQGDLMDDRAASEFVRSRMRRQDATRLLDDVDRPSDVQGVFAAADLVVAMRLHAVILAANAGAPVVAVADDPRVRDTMDRIGLARYAVDLEHLDGAVLAERVTTAAGDRTGIRQDLRARLPAMRSGASRNMAALVDLLDRPRQPSAPLSPEWTAFMTRALLLQIRRAAVHDASVDFLRGELASTSRRLADRETTLTETTRLLDERTRDLAAVAAALAEARADLEATPAAGYRRFRHRVRSTARTWGRAVSGAGRAVFGPPARLAGAVYRTLVPSPARSALGRALSAGFMSWPEYLFDRFKRSRIAIYGGSLAGLRDAGEPGLVSIVLPAYNGAALVRESIDSVLAQTWRSFELIVVDNGSTDDTARIAESYSAIDSRVRVLRLPHGRLTRALSHGFRRARGEFLTWTTSDHRMKPEFLARMVECLRRHPDWDMAYANVDLIGARGHVHLPASTAELNVVANNSVGPAFLYRARVATLLGNYSEWRFAMGDHDYWMRVNALLTLRHADFDDPVYEYRFHRQSLVSPWTELETLKNRERLMVFDDFRRDFFLVPMLWVIDGQGRTATTLADRVRQAGHVLYDGHVPLATLPRAAVPVVFVHVTEHAASAVFHRADLPATALKVLVTDASTLPAQVAGDWDLCCAVGAPAAVPRLGRDHQGWLAAADVATLFQAVDIRAKSSHVEALEAMAEGGDGPALRATVVVCTRRRTDQLVTTLRAVAAQTFPPSAYELVVVGNDLHDITVPAAVEDLRASAFFDRPDRIRFVRCPVPGLSIARNAGLAESRGEFVAFLDDDAVPEADWLAQLAAAYDAHPEAGVIGGHITLEPPSPRPAALKRGWEKYWSAYVTEHRQYMEAADWRQFPWGANWSAQRVALRQVGGFRARYGRSGDNYWGGEELVAACLIQRLGYTVGVAPQARAAHRVKPDRFTFEHVRRTMTAGHQVGHHAQRDLYLPREALGLLPGLGQMLTHHMDRDLEPGDRWLDAVYRKRAQLRLVAAEAADIGRRARRPIVGAR